MHQNLISDIKTVDGPAWLFTICKGVYISINIYRNEFKYTFVYLCTHSHFMCFFMCVLLAVTVRLRVTNKIKRSINKSHCRHLKKSMKKILLAQLNFLDRLIKGIIDFEMCSSRL